MKRDDYINCPDVKAFIDWAAKLVSGEWGLVQGYTYENYDWPSKVKLADGSIRRTRTFDETAALFDEFRYELKKATSANPATDSDRDAFLETANRIVIWGGIRKLALPESRLNKLGRDALLTLKDNSELLEPESADTKNLRGFKYMGAGFSKIYSAMIDDFPIYDSRVACALTSLIWLFCERNRPTGVPESLKLGIPVDRSSQNRNPYGFPNIQGAQYRKHADSNLKAAWILGELAEIEEGDFSKVPKESRVRALEAALFMIGDRPLKKDAIRKA